MEDEVSSEQPPDTLEEEEEYEKQQEELRREEAQASHSEYTHTLLWHALVFTRYHYLTASMVALFERYSIRCVSNTYNRYLYLIFEDTSTSYVMGKCSVSFLKKCLENILYYSTLK